VKKGLAGVSEIFKTTYRYGYWGRPDDLYRPLTLIFFAIQWDIWPDNPFPPHLFNVLLYSLLCVVIFLFLKRIFAGYSIWLPLISTLLFAAHPLHTEVVANIKSLDEILCMLFLISTAWFVLNFAEKKDVKSMLVALILYFLAFLSKESAILFLAVFPLLLYFFTKTETRRIIIISLLMLIPAVIFLVIRKNVVGSISGDVNVNVVDNLLSAAGSTGERTATAVKIMGIYLLKQIFPHPLVSDYSFNQIPIVSWSNIGALISLLFHLFIGVFALVNLKKKTVLSFAILFYFVTISLYSNIFFQIGSSFGERFLFVPILGFVIAAAWLMIRFLSPDSMSSEKKPNSMLIWVVGIILVLFSIKTFFRNSEWRSNEILYEADVKKSPNSAHMRYYYGLSLMKEKAINEKGDVIKPAYLDSAIVQFQIAANIYPYYADAYDQLGLAWFRKKDFDKSIFYYEKALALNPAKPITYSNMGSIYFQAGKYDKALDIYRKAVELNPLFADGWLNLGSTYGTVGKYPESIAAFKKCLELAPQSALAHYYLGLSYNSAGDFVNGEIYLKKAAAMDPQFMPKDK
jgi:tetratricopeptide (TPR) repeat protein